MGSFYGNIFCILVCSALRRGWNGDVCLGEEGSRARGLTNPGARWLDHSGTSRPFCITGSSFVCELWSRCALDSSRLHDLLMANMSWHFKLRLLDFSPLMPWGIFLLMFQQQILRKKRLLLKPMKCMFFFPNDWVSNKSFKKKLPCLVASGLVSTWNRFKAYLKLFDRRGELECCSAPFRQLIL